MSKWGKSQSWNFMKGLKVSLKIWINKMHHVTMYAIFLTALVSSKSTFFNLGVATPKGVASNIYGGREREREQMPNIYIYIMISLTLSKIIALIVFLSWTVILFSKYLYYMPSLNNNSLFRWMYDIPVCGVWHFRRDIGCTNYVATCTQIWCFRYIPVKVQLCPYD